MLIMYLSKFKIKKIYYDLKAKLILKLIGDMPVIVNCTIYDDILSYNFSNVADKPCIAFNNKIEKFSKHASKYNKAVVLTN